MCDRLGLYVVDEANIETHGMLPKPSRLSGDPNWRGAYMERLQVGVIFAAAAPEAPAVVGRNRHIIFQVDESGADLS